MDAPRARCFLSCVQVLRRIRRCAHPPPRTITNTRTLPEAEELDEEPPPLFMFMHPARCACLACAAHRNHEAHALAKQKRTSAELLVACDSMLRA